MSLVTLFNRDAGWLATDQRIFASDSLEDTLGVVELAAELSRLIDCQQAVIEQARREGFAAGLAQGADEARQAGRQTTAQALLALEHRYAGAEAQQRDQVSQLAVEVVRRIAASVAPAEWLYAQASTAAGDLMDESRLVLRVHASNADTVRALWQNASGSPICEVRGEDGMDIDTCIIETPRGSIDVDLHTQLHRIEHLLSGGNS